MTIATIIFTRKTKAAAVKALAYAVMDPITESLNARIIKADGIYHVVRDFAPEYDSRPSTRTIAV